MAQAALFEVEEVRPTERAWQATVVAALHDLGWVTNVQVPRRTRNGWQAASTARGWPDVVAFRGGWMAAIEIKADGEYPRPDQREWLRHLAALPQSLVLVLRPADDGRVPWRRWLAEPSEAPTTYGWRMEARAA